jgi:hypothetical protein
LICRLAAADPHRRIVITSGPSDARAAAQVAEPAPTRLAPADREAVLRAGEFNLTELRALIAARRLHRRRQRSAARRGTTGVPVVGLYGPTLPIRSQPWRGRSFISEAAQAGDPPAVPAISAGASRATSAA